MSVGYDETEGGIPLAAEDSLPETWSGVGPDAVLARFAHSLASGPLLNTATGIPQVTNIPPELEEEAKALPNVPLYLNRGLALKRWWNDVEANQAQVQTFPLNRAFNSPNRSYGFFGHAPVDGQLMPVMGNVQEMFYDQARAPQSHAKEIVAWTQQQLREFVMKYFMRISSFREPQTFVEGAQPVAPPLLKPFSWCPRAVVERSGFGFSQLFSKARDSSIISPIPSSDRYRIVDQRDLDRLYEWLFLKVRIFDFDFSTRPFGQRGPELVFGLNEESLLVTNRELIRYQEGHLPGVLGDYGIGYAFVRGPADGIFGYGPGDFDAAIELINFRIYETGYISVRMIFVANRPHTVTKVMVDPVDWSLRLANIASLGLASRIVQPARRALGKLPLRFAFDPVRQYIDAANAVSNGAAGRDLCISTERLEKLFLEQHFRQHYQTVLGSLLTWRMIPDWLDEENLPVWVRLGFSS